MKPTKTKPRKNTAALLERAKRHLAYLALTFVIACQACSTTQTKPPATPSLKAFESDGCTCVPDGPHSDSDRWTPACEKHDLTYWKGGSHRDRLNADRRLKAAIKESGHPFISEIYFIGTRFGGSPYFPTPWRWGFGRPWPRGYQRTSNPDS